LEIRRADDLGTMRADSTKVRQVLLNLLSNATKFTEHGTITLTVEREMIGGMDWLRFGVSDTGIGIARDKIQELFREFTQGDDSPTRKYGGTGLGLTISRHYCELMGGRITVASEPGVGSTFVVYLPAEVAGPTTPPTM
jgi:signal transduction histidine kinase